MSVQSIEQRIAELLHLRRKVDDELARLAAVAGVEKPRHRSKKVIPECGTESAYQRHRYYGEPQDDACRAAHNEYERVRSEMRKARARAERLARVVTS
jgi:hypothetical protein